MKTEKGNSHEGAKALRKNYNYLKTSCLRVLVAKTGFTLVEILTVVVIIAILMGLLMPALSQIKKVAKEARQKAQIYSIEVGIELYKEDFGEYPPSHGLGSTCAIVDLKYSYCGAQTLTEAMLGYDLLGVHPDTIYRTDGLDESGGTIYPAVPTATNLDERKGPYLDRTNISVFKPRDIFNKDTCDAYLEPDRYVICDVFTAVTRNITLPGGVIRNYKVGTPILYFRANESALNTELVPLQTKNEDNIYNWWENYWLVVRGRVADGDGEKHPICPGEPPSADAENGVPFYNFIRDPMIPASAGTSGRPVRPDTYILISAGYDGLYGTPDDICNFKPNIE
jgi:prepilin-type N-terminal cleavage/methylation domain-containing protein